MIRRPLAVFLGIAALTLLLDQVSKAVVRASLPLHESIGLVPGVFYLTHIENVGAAFGLLPGQRILFVLVSVVVLFVITVYIVRQKPASAWVVFALGLIAGGALGNLVDRAGAGVVTDFFEFGFVEFPVFNVADSAIVVGVTILIAWLVFAPVDPAKNAMLESDGPGEPGGEESSPDGGGS